MIAIDMPAYLPKKYSVDFPANEIQNYSKHASKECENEFLLIDGSESKIKSFKENSKTFNASFNGSHRYSVICLTRMHPMVRTAKALRKGFTLSLAS